MPKSLYAANGFHVARDHSRTPSRAARFILALNVRLTYFRVSENWASALSRALFQTVELPNPQESQWRLVLPMDHATRHRLLDGLLRSTLGEVRRRFEMRFFLLTLIFLWSLPAVPVQADETEDRLATAEEHLKKGRYAEALTAYDALKEQEKIAGAVAIGRSRCFQAEGRWKECTESLQQAVKRVPQHAKLWATLAEVQFLQGRYEEAERAVGESLKIDNDQTLARLVQADLWTARGQLNEADDGYRWFVRYYNRKQPEDAETLLLVARGTAQYARWNSVSQIFNFAVNTLCPDALSDDENCWEADWISGCLLLEKYNRTQGMPDLRKALAINPRAAIVYAELARASLQEHEIEKAHQFVTQALEIDPRHVDALQIRGDLEFSNGQFAVALATWNEALAVNPLDEETLGRIAGGVLLLDGPPPEKELQALLDLFSDEPQPDVNVESRFAKIVSALAARNPRPGRFLTVVGGQLESRRKFALAEQFYKKAMERMPKLSDPQTALGMLYMQIGKVNEARKYLDRAFELDPYHVRVSNMRKVVSVLSEYATITTDHFVIRVDSKLDKVLGRYIAEFLEEEYEKLTTQFGFEPPARTQFEIYNKAKGLSAHQWFSSRMVGLPWIQTIGASTGMIVAMASPTAADQEYNWARVVRHEFVHIITLQQTDFNIPHWFTEALAVRNEGYPRPQSWNEMLLKRVPKGEMYNLNNINQTFVRPEKPEDWQMAYCQSELYAEYMVAKHGPDTLGKMLEAYRDGLSTSAAIKRVCGVDQDAFERGYLDFVRKLVEGLSGKPAQENLPLADLEKAHLADKEDLHAAGRYAYALMQAEKTQQAQELAQKVWDRDPEEPWAALVLAQKAVNDEGPLQAAGYLEQALDPENPNLEIAKRLGPLRQQTNDFAGAAELFELVLKENPTDTAMIEGLAELYLKTGNTVKLKPILRNYVEIAPDKPAPRKNLAMICLADEEFADAAKYAKMALHIDVLDADVHRTLAAAFVGLKQYPRAIEEYEVAIELKPGDAELLFGLAAAQIHSENLSAAKKSLERLLKIDPDHVDARTLLDEL